MISEIIARLSAIPDSTLYFSDESIEEWNDEGDLRIKLEFDGVTTEPEGHDNFNKSWLVLMEEWSFKVTGYRAYGASDPITTCYQIYNEIKDNFDLSKMTNSTMIKATYIDLGIAAGSKLSYAEFSYNVSRMIKHGVQ